MSRHDRFSSLSLLGILLLNAFLTGRTDAGKIHAAQATEKSRVHESLLQCRIGGTVTDVFDGALLENAEVSLLDPVTRVALLDGIVTDASGGYEATLDIETTNVSNAAREMPLHSRISEAYPNPVPVAGSDGITIRYRSPAGETIAPILEVYNILGKKIDPGGLLAGGVYLYRLKFADGHVSETKKMLLAGSGRFNISLQPVLADSKASIGKGGLPPSTARVMNDSVEVLYAIKKNGYAFQKQSRVLYSGMDNVHNFSLVRSSDEISGFVGSSGGLVKHPGGLTVAFQEGAFSVPVAVSLSTTDLPDSLPSGLIRVSPVYSVSTGGLQPQNCGIISIALSGEYEAGTLGIYRWNGEEWQYVGGDVAAGALFTYMRDFSLFFAGVAGSKVYRLFRFENTGLNSAMVYVRTYRLLHPDWDVPITYDQGTPCFAQPFEPPVGGNRGWYPQGFYQFCADWFDDVYGPRHRIIGGDPPHWTYSLNEYTSLIVPPTVFVDTGITGSLEGLCPCAITRVGLPATGLNGIWSGFLPFPWDATNIEIHDGYWNLITEVLAEIYPVILINDEEQYFILMNYDGAGYLKVTWILTGDQQMNLSFFVASSAWDAHPTVDGAINDTTAEIENAPFSKTSGGF
ncbi:T9SS type A sorting domain-containing protein [bacterium]|nr:T9SS type A sorting domain-containing protein [bacterium]